MQTVGVDEGSIVKLHGNHLVVLRRGRLFTINIADQSLRPVAWINAYGPGMDPDSTWYDEMLIHGDRIVVIGYSYRRGGTEVALFDIDSNGLMRYDATYFLSSDDYYSSRNYASRLTDGKLIFYTPAGLSNLDSLPRLRRWPTFMPPDRKAAKDDKGVRIIPATRIYRPARELPAGHGVVLHTITTCDLDAPQFSCQATGVVGAAGEAFYVSQTAVYVWTNPSGRAQWQQTNLPALSAAARRLAANRHANVRQSDRSVLVPRARWLHQCIHRLGLGGCMDVGCGERSRRARVAARAVDRICRGQLATQYNPIPSTAQAEAGRRIP